jgi:hypothetical protein
MRSLPRRFGNLFGRRSAAKASRRRNPKRGMGRGFESPRFSRVESLESRAMLAADLEFDTNVFVTESSTVTATERTTTVGLSVNGVTGLNVGFNALNDSVYVHQAFDSQNVLSFSLSRPTLTAAGFNTSVATGGGRDAYSFYTSDSLEVGTRLAVIGDLSGNGDVGVEDLILHLEATYPDLTKADDNGVKIVRSYAIQGFNFADSSNGFMTIASNAKIEISRITGSKQTLATGVTTITAQETHTLWDFDTIRASAGGAAEDVGFYFAAGGVTVSKPTFVDFSGSAGDSTFFVGTPLAVTTGGMSVNAAIQDFNANVAVSGEVVLETTGDGSGDASRGIFVRRNLFAGAAGVGNVSVIANGADFRMEAGSKIGAAGGAQLNTFNLDLTDASSQIAGTIKADTHQYILRGTNLGLNSLARSITTVDPSTGLHRGSLEGDEMFVTLNNAVDKTVDLDAEDGSIDVRAAVDTLRVATGLDVPLNYAISVSNLDDLTVDAVMATEGDISLESRQGTLSLDAVIDTFGGVTLTSFDDLDIDTQLSTAQGALTLISNGDVNINAAISTADTVAGLITVIAGDETDPTSASSITVTSLVEAAVEVSLTATGSVLTVDPAGAGSDPSLLRAPTAVIAAGSVINVGLNIEETITASSGGAMTIRDYGDEWVAGAQQPALELLDLESTNGTITVEAVRSILATSVVAGGAGDISLTTTEGDIELVDIAAVGNRVTLVAEGFDDEDDADADPTTLHLGGTITLVDPTTPVIASAMDFTVFDLDTNDNGDVTDSEEFFAGIGTLAATLVGDGDLLLASDASLVIERAITSNGSIEIIAQGGVTIAAEGVLAEGGDVSVAAVGGGITVGSDIAAADVGSIVTLAALQSINGSASLASPGVTAGITAGEINLFAGLGGGSSGIGIATPVAVRGLNAIDGTTVTAGAAGVNVFVGEHFDVATLGDDVVPSELHLLGTTSVTLIADVAEEIDVAVSGGNSVLTVSTATVAGKDGLVTLSSEYDIILEDTISVEAGANTGGSVISLSAGRFIDNSAGGELEAETVILAASTFNADPAGVGFFDGEVLDTVEVLSVTATSPTGQIFLEFDRLADLELAGISAVGGAVTLSIADSTAVETPSFIIGAGDIVASGDSTVALTAEGDIASTSSVGVVAGTIRGGAAVLTADGDVDVNTAVSQIEAAAVSIAIVQTGDVQISANNLEANTGAGDLDLTVLGGAILASTGKIVAGAAVVSAANGMSLLTDVDTISAVSVAGDIEITEEDGLTLGSGGINAGFNDVSLVLTTGDLTGASQTITGNLVSVELEDSGDIDILTNAAVLSAVTFDGDITIENAGGFSIGEDGVIAGAGGVDDVVLVATTGSIAAGIGVIEAAGLTIEAAGAISVATEVDTVVAANELGGITISNSDRDLEVTDIQTTSGAVTVLNDDGDVTVKLIVARGLAGDVTIVTTGLDDAAVDAAAVTLETSSIDARRDVEITSAGGITGDADLFSADVVAGSVTLLANDGDLTASVETDDLVAQTLGVDNDLDVTQIGTRPVFLGTGANATVLSSTGDLTFTSSRPDDAVPAANDIIVTELPEFGDGATLSLNTDADLIYAVTTSSLTASGSLNDAMQNASDHGNDGAGETRVAFSNQIRSSIVLTETIDVTGTMVLDGTLRINLQTGGYTIGRPVDIDGSRMRDGSLYAFDIGAGADDSVLSGMAFYGFNEDGGAAINIDGADDVVIANNSFGITSAGRASRNANGIIIANSTGSEITGNVIVLSSDVGIQVDSGVDTLTISGNSIGTNLTRRNYRNTIGILVDGSWSDSALIGDPSDDTFTVDGVDITDNFIAFNSDAGIVVRGATDVSVEGNTVTLNGTGIMVGDASVVGGSSLSDTIALFGNEVTRSSGNGIEVTEGSRDVAIGGTGVDEANFIGTNARGSRGLGNRANGVLIEEAGSGVSLAGNTILGNGTRRSDSDQNGVKVVGQVEEVEIEDNQIGENRGDGILADGATTEATIVRNSIFANYGSGVRATSTTFANLVIGSLTGTNGNVISSNRRFGIDLSGGAATVGGNSMLGNRRGGIDSGVVAPVVSSATLANGDDLTVTLASALAADDVVHVYLGTGRSTSSEGLTYLGRFVATGGETSFTLLSLNPALRVRIGSSITVTLTESDGAGIATASTSEFSRNVSVRRV